MLFATMKKFFLKGLKTVLQTNNEKHHKVYVSDETVRTETERLEGRIDWLTLFL